jgi:hypothetical protein
VVYPFLTSPEPEAAIGAAGDEHSGVDKSGSGYIFVRQGGRGQTARGSWGYPFKRGDETKIKW